MAGMIPRDFIDDLLTRVDIVDVINPRVTLKKKGREYTACCPFHNEKTPSFTVSPSKQFYHCFGCGVHGSAISFLMEYEHLEFVESIETLARSIGVEVPYEKGSKPSEKKQQQNKNLYSLLEEVARFYQTRLKCDDIAKNYLQQRELSGEIVARFGVGYAPSGWDTVLNEFSNNYSKQQLLDVGLVIQKDNGREYDRFRERVMFPIRDRRGRVIGFGGRVIGDGTPKYLNSPETSVFHKGLELYGLYEARNHTRKLDRILVVEGYMDVIALAQHDITYAVATLGTATTPDHITQIFRLVPETIFCFDGDRAGRDAAWRALENALPILRDGKEIRFLFLPTGEDPDTQVRKIGKEAFEQSLDQESISLTDYMLDHLQKQFNISSREGKSRFLERAGKLLKTMSDSLIKDQLLLDVAKLTSIDPEILRTRKIGGSLNEPVQSFSRLKEQEVRVTPIRYAISLLLARPDLAALVDNPEQIMLFDLPGSNLLATLIESIEDNPNINAAALIERWRGTEYEASLTSLIKWQPESDDDEILAQEFQDCLRQIRKQAHEKKLEILLQKDRTGELNNQEKKDLMVLFQEVHRQ
jgi:DNA primase